MTTPTPTLGARILDWILKLYPKSFRQRFESDVRATHR